MGEKFTEGNNFTGILDKKNTRSILECGCKLILFIDIDIDSKGVQYRYRYQHIDSKSILDIYMAIKMMLFYVVLVLHRNTLKAFDCVQTNE